MKCAARIALAVSICLIFGGIASTSALANVSFEVFYSDLSPHGSWLVSARFGRVWQPGVYASGWNPYLDGHWIYTDLGWTWVSDYGWGGIPYHYGTWVIDPALGWVWVPGYTWAPSWVVFRTGPDYIGWAPVSPGFQISVNLGVPAAPSFVFVSSQNFMAPRVRPCTVIGQRRATAFRQTQVVNRISIENNLVVNRSVDVARVERVSGQRVPRVSIERVARSGAAPRSQRGQLQVDPGRMKVGVRAAEPVPAGHPLPGLERKEIRREPPGLSSGSKGQGRRGKSGRGNGDS